VGSRSSWLMNVFRATTSSWLLCDGSAPSCYVVQIRTYDGFWGFEPQENTQRFGVIPHHLAVVTVLGRRSE